LGSNREVKQHRHDNDGNAGVDELQDMIVLGLPGQFFGSLAMKHYRPQDQYPGDRFDSLQIMINLKKIAIALAASTLIFGCTKLLVGEDPKNTAVDTFETFWHGVDATWPEFESKHANWDSVYSLYRPQVTASTQNADLQRIFQAMLPVLRDGHTSHVGIFTLCLFMSRGSIPDIIGARKQDDDLGLDALQFAML